MKVKTAKVQLLGWFLTPNAPYRQIIPLQEGEEGLEPQEGWLEQEDDDCLDQGHVVHTQAMVLHPN